MAQNRSARLITKRTSVPGKIPTGTTGNEGNFIQSGELASNLADHSLWGYDGTDVFEYGSNSFLGLTGGIITGDTRVVGNFSADTFFSGSTNVETIIRNLITSDVHTFVQPGSNIITGGTPQSPIISTVDSPSFNNILFSGTANGGDIFATNLSASTFYSGSTELGEIIDSQIDTALTQITVPCFDGYDLVGGATSITTAWTATVPLDSQRQTDSSFTHSTVTNNDEVTINEAGKYTIIGRASATSTASTSRTQAECRLEIDTGTGFAEVQGTIAEMYVRLSNHGATGGFQGALDLEIGDKLRITFRRRTGGGTIVLQPNGSSLTVTKLAGGPKGDKGLTGDLNLNGFTDFYVSGTTFSNVFSGNTQEAVYYGDGSNLDGIVVSDISYMIWAEESGSLSNNSRQWSFGNGAVGNINVYNMYDAEISKMFIDSEAVGTSVSIDLMVNDIAVATVPFTSNGVYTFPSPINILEGDAIGFRTNTVVGTWTDARVGVAVVNQVTGLKGDKGETGSLSAATDLFISDTVYSDVYSGNTTEAVYYGDGSNLTGIVHDLTRVQGGTNVFTAGTANTPIINLENDIILNSIQAVNLSGNTIFSGGTDLYNIFQTIHDVDRTEVQPGSNILTGGTANKPIISTVASPSFNNVTFSGTATGGDAIFSEMSATTLYSGNTDMSDLFLPQGATSLNALTDVSITGTPTNNEILKYNSGTTLWEPVSIEALIENVVSNAEIYVTNNISATTIVTQNVPVQITSSDAFNADFITNFSHDGNGVITYIGDAMIRISTDATMHFQSTNNQDINFFVAVNTGGTYSMITSSQGPSRTQGASETTFANPKCLYDINTGDKLALFVENTTSTNNVLVQGFNWTINA